MRFPVWYKASVKSITKLKAAAVMSRHLGQISEAGQPSETLDTIFFALFGTTRTLLGICFVNIYKSVHISQHTLLRTIQLRAYDVRQARHQHEGSHHKIKIIAFTVTTESRNTPSQSSGSGIRRENEKVGKQQRSSRHRLAASSDGAACLSDGGQARRLMIERVLRIEQI